jgi:hypothetical protein
MRCQSQIASASATSESAAIPARLRAALIIPAKTSGNARDLLRASPVIVTIVSPFSFEPSNEMPFIAITAMLGNPSLELLENLSNVESRRQWISLDLI